MHDNASGGVNCLSTWLRFMDCTSSSRSGRRSSPGLQIFMVGSIPLVANTGRCGCAWRAQSRHGLPTVLLQTP